MLAGLDVVALETLELSYAPPFGSARDPVNYAGMIAADTLRGDTVPVYADEIPADALLLDVREPGGVPDRGPSGRQAKARGTLQGGIRPISSEIIGLAERLRRRQPAEKR